MRVRHPLALLLCVALAALGLTAITTSSASATPVIGSGTLLYRKGVNIFATDGTSTRQLTTDGGTPSADGKGSTGYLYPSESADGSVVVAARNQMVTSADQQQYLRGYLWVMDAYGHVIRKINPPQYAYDGGTYCGMPANAPQGIANAQVSPDGRHIAYTMTELVEVDGFYGCYVATGYRTTVVDIDGTDPVAVDNGNGSNESLDMGSWVDNDTLLLDDGDFGSVQAYYASLPNMSGTAWFGPASDDWTTTAYLQPAYRNGIVATQGLTQPSNVKAVRIWTANGLGASPTFRCERTSSVSGDDGLGDPTLSPDGTQVAYEDVGANESTSVVGQGVYVMSTSSCSTGLLVQGANDAFWTSAPLNPPRDTSAPTVSLDATPTAIAASTTNLRWSGQDTGSGIASYQLQYRAAAYGKGFGGWNDLGTADPSTSTGITGMGPGATYCFRVVAEDNAGNTGTSNERCTAVALDDRSLKPSSGWRRVTGKAYYLGTATTTTRRGATLTRAAGTLDRVGIVATTCRGCGTVGVYVGSRLVGQVSLSAGSTHQRVVRLLPGFSRRTAAVTVKVLTSGKPVTIDGLVGLGD